MPIEHRIGETYNGGAGTVSSTQRTFSGDGEVRFNGTIAAGAVNTQITVALTRTAIKSCVLFSTQTVTVKTNNATTPVDTITLTANVARIWGNDELLSRLVFTADVTTLFVSNAGATAAAFRLEALVDVTPGV